MGHGKKVAHASISINAPVVEVWDALTNPSLIKKYMFGTEVITTWEEGSDISWKGEWQGKEYHDKGKVLEFKTNKRLRYSHYTGTADDPDKVHIVTIDLSEEGGNTIVTLSQDNNSS